jgi:hypothetical protein
MRAMARRGEWRATTGGHCPAYQQANVTKLQLPNERNVEALRAQAKLITETESKTRERFHEFNKLVTEDLKRINAMIAAAEALGRKMPEEQKKRVLG